MSSRQLTPPTAFLQSVFPSGEYPRDGRRIAAERRFQPRPDVDSIVLDFPIDWEASDRRGDRNWRMQLQGFAMLHPLLDLFDSMDDPSPGLDYAFDIFEDWWAAHSEDPIDVVTSRMPESYAWYDMSVGYRALVIAFFAQRSKGRNISQHRTSLLKNLTDKHRAHLRNPAVFYPNNHGIFQIHGLMAMAQGSDDSDAESDIHYANRVMASLLERQFDVAGIHTEHSPEYHIIILRTFERALSTGWYQVNYELTARLQKAEEAIAWMIGPDQRIAAIGDSAPHIYTADEPQREIASTGLMASTMDRSGYAILRESGSDEPMSNSYLFLTGAYNSSVHKHRDCLSFEWHDRGRKRLTDSGKYGYHSDRFRTYVLSHQAHNTVSIEGFDILKMSPYGSAIESVDPDHQGVGYIRAQLSFPAFVHLREIYMKPGSWLLVDDQIELTRPRETVQWNHIALDHSLVSSTEDRFCFTSESGALIVSNLTKRPGALHFGDLGSMQGFVSDNDNEVEAGYAIGFKSNEKHARNLTAFSLSISDEMSAEAFCRGRLGIDVEPRALQHTNGQGDGESHWTGQGAEAASFVDSEFTANVHTSAGQVMLTAKKGDTRVLVVDFGDGQATSHFENGRIAEGQHSYIAITDPTLSYGNLLVGWFQGVPGGRGIPELASLINAMSSSLSNDTDVVLVGTGVGAHGAVKVFNEIGGQVIALKPTGVEAFGSEAKEAMLSLAYPNWDRGVVETVFERYLDPVGPEDFIEVVDQYSDTLISKVRAAYDTLRA